MVKMFEMHYQSDDWDSPITADINVAFGNSLGRVPQSLYTDNLVFKMQQFL